MALALSRDSGYFEWAGTFLLFIICQLTNLLSLRFWRMLFDIIRFNHFALDLLIEDDGGAVNDGLSPAASIGEYLDSEGYSAAFREGYLIPMTAAVWRTSPNKCALDFPALALVRFFWNRDLLSTISAKPKFLTPKYCGQSYINAIMEGFPKDHVFLNTSVRSLMNEPSGKVRLLLENGSTALYDQVILATHGDQAYSIIEATATPQESSILSAFESSQTKAVLHSDTSLLLRSPIARCCWNYNTRSAPGRSNVDSGCLTYDMNSLQHIPRDTFGDVLVTLNPLWPPRPEAVRAEFEYAHPLCTPEAVRAQARLQEIQGVRGLRYAGAWTGYGSHEDGFTSGLRAAESLAGTVRFAPKDSAYGRGRKPDLGLEQRAIRMVISLVQVAVVGPLEWAFGTEREADADKKQA